LRKFNFIEKEIFVNPLLDYEFQFKWSEYPNFIQIHLFYLFVVISLVPSSLPFLLLEEENEVHLFGEAQECLWWWKLP
jgi:hypothetical protein